jgi:hypothetical protein
MSALLAITGEAPPPLSVLLRMLERLASRGSGEPVVDSRPGAWLAVRQHDWQGRLSGVARCAVTRRDAVSVIADATLHYRSELKAELAAAGEPVRGRWRRIFAMESRRSVMKR